MRLRYHYDKPEKPRILRVFGCQAWFLILFQPKNQDISSEKKKCPFLSPKSNAGNDANADQTDSEIRLSIVP